MPYRDQVVDPGTRAAVARQRMPQVTLELEAVRDLEHEVRKALVAAERAEARERDALDATQPGLWAQLAELDRRPIKLPVDPRVIAQRRVDVILAITARESAARVVELVRERAEAISRERDALATEAAASADLPHDVDAHVRRAAAEDAREMAATLCTALVALDEQAAGIQRAAIRAALEGRDAEDEARGSVFVAALRELAIAHARARLLHASLRSFASGGVVDQAAALAVTFDAPARASAPDEAWRRQIAALRAAADEVRASLERSLVA